MFITFNKSPEGRVLVAVRSQELRELLLYLGPCYVKLGQALCSRVVQGSSAQRKEHTTL